MIRASIRWGRESTRLAGKEHAMTSQNETSLRLHAPRSHALRDVVFFAALLVGIAAFVAQSVGF
jgi:hypothetical protein